MLEFDKSNLSLGKLILSSETQFEFAGFWETQSGYESPNSELRKLKLSFRPHFEFEFDSSVRETQLEADSILFWS